jgi:hypothetical protein
MSEKTHKGYTLSKNKKKRIFVDSEGYCFKIGHARENGTVYIRYLLAKRETALFGGNVPFISLELAAELYLNLVGIPEKKQEKEEKLEKLHDMYKPGGIGYLMTKQSSKVGKKQ